MTARSYAAIRGAAEMDRGRCVRAVVDPDGRGATPGPSAWPCPVLIGAGVVVDVWCFCVFVVAGHGTPATSDAPRRVVAVGTHQWVRNPIYVGALMIIEVKPVVFHTAAQQGPAPEACQGVVHDIARHLGRELDGLQRLRHSAPADDPSPAIHRGALFDRETVCSARSGHHC